MSSEVRIEGLETLDYLDNLKNKERFTEQGDAITFESEVNIYYKYNNFFVLIIFYWFNYITILFHFFMLKVDKVYLNTPTKIAIIDHERKRTFVLRKDGLPDAGEFNIINSPPYIHKYYEEM